MGVQVGDFHVWDASRWCCPGCMFLMAPFHLAKKETTCTNVGSRSCTYVQIQYDEKELRFLQITCYVFFAFFGLAVPILVCTASMLVS